MARFALRHWTALLIILVLIGWGLFYLPSTPSYAVFELKQAVDARDGAGAAGYVDFQKVVRNAGYEIVKERNDRSTGSGADIIGQLFGNSAVDLFSGPMAGLLQQWAVQKVDNGDRDIQMPAAALIGAVILLHRDGHGAYTRWTDHKGQVWEVRMEREDGGWKIVQVKNVAQLLRKLEHHEEKQMGVSS